MEFSVFVESIQFIQSYLLLMMDKYCPKDLDQLTSRIFFYELTTILPDNWMELDIHFRVEFHYSYLILIGY